MFSAAIYLDHRCLANSKHLVELDSLALQDLTPWMYVDPETRGGVQDPQGVGTSSCSLAVAPGRFGQCRPFAYLLEANVFGGLCTPEYILDLHWEIGIAIKRLPVIRYTHPSLLSAVVQFHQRQGSAPIRCSQHTKMKCKFSNLPT